MKKTMQAHAVTLAGKGLKSVALITFVFHFGVLVYYE